MISDGKISRDDIYALFILIGILAILGIVALICDIIQRVRKKKAVKMIRSFTRDDFIIETRNIIIKEKVKDLIWKKESVKTLSNEEYLLITPHACYSKDSGTRLDNSVFDKTFKVSFDDYKLFKDFTKDFDCIELEASELILQLSDDARKKCYMNKELNSDSFYKYYILRVNIPYICKHDEFSDEDIEAVVKKAKERLEFVFTR